MSDSRWSESPKKKRKKKTVSSDKTCIIHVRDSSEAVSNFSAKSWNIAYMASLKRGDNLLESFQKDLVPDKLKYGYHWKCYQSYTNIKQLAKFTESTEDLQDEVQLRHSSRNVNLRGSCLAPNICIICEKNKTSSTGSGYEENIKCITESTATVLFSYCQDGNDYQKAQIATAATPLDLIAKEFRFHRSCYRDLTRQAKPCPKDHQAREECFEKIISFVEENIIQNGDVVRLSCLSEMYQELQKNKSISIQGVENRSLKSRLVFKLNDKIAFFKKKTTSVELVYSLSDQAKHPINQNEDVLRKAATQIKNDIAALGNQFSSWPPPIEEIRSDQTKLPDSLSKFLEILFVKNKKTERTDRLVRSLGQDILFCSSNGRLKTVKHLQLGVFTKRKTGSKLMVECLNRLGHSLSYCEINRFETALAEQESKNAVLKSFTPSNVQPSTFVSFVYDNCDHNAETLSGKVMHCTNGILIQKKSSSQKISSPQPACGSKDIRRRSFKPIEYELQPYRSSKEKVNVAPSSNDIQLQNHGITNIISQMSDFVWVVARVCSADNGDQVVPSWTGFHTEISEQQESFPHEIHYLPTINESPTKLETVQEVLLQAKAKAENLNLTSCDLILDHAIYCKALEVLNNPNHVDLKNFINLRMGPFHACCIFLAVIGKRFGSAGLRDIIVEANLTGPGSVESVLRGKHYNRGLRVMKAVYESLHRLKLESFETWLRTTGKHNIFVKFCESREMKELVETRSSSNFQKVLDVSIEIENLYIDFEENIAQGMLGPMAKFWQSFLEMMQILLDYIKSTRSGDWELHMCSMERMLPWFHSYDRINYARHFTYCWATLKDLPNIRPQIFAEFQQGNFSVQRTLGKFNKLPPDQVIEQTINKEQKGPGGIIGISTSVGSVQRWIFTSHFVAEINVDFKRSLAIEESTETKDLGKARKILDESLVRDCTDVIKYWQNPFCESSELVSLTSGIAASDKLRDDMDNAKEIGMASVEEFVAKRIKTTEVPLNDTIKKKNLLTFDDMKKKQVSKSKDVIMAMRSEREMFARLLLVQKNRDLDIRRIMNHELTQLPLSLANADGSLAKTMKSKLFHRVSELIPTVMEVPNNTPSIFDGMVLFQKLPPTLLTFGEIADYVLKKVLGKCQISFFVTDNYLQNSIKSLERRQRSTSGSLRIKINQRNQRKPKSWSSYLQHSENKIELVKFLIKDWSTNEENISKLENKKLYVTCEAKAHSIFVNDSKLKCQDVLQLYSSQEEADTKIFLCTQFAASEGYPSVKIITVDTDVAILSIYFSSKISSKLYLEIGTGLRKSIYDISSGEIESHISDALPGLHALTGCDSTSSFNGIGKIKSYNLMEKNETFTSALQLLGTCNEVPESARETIEEFVCHLYGCKTSKNLNEARYVIITERNKLPDPHKLPPSSDAFQQHLKRANYQTIEWKQALSAEHLFIDPNNHGWCTRENKLEVQWTSLPTAPNTLIELMSCKCKKTKCQNNSCGCKKANLRCSDICQCIECENNKRDEFDEYEYFDDSEDSSEEDEDD